MKTYIVRYKAKITNKKLYMDMEICASNERTAGKLARIEATQYQTWVGPESVDWVFDSITEKST